MSLPPPATQTSPPLSPGLLNGSLPVTVESGQAGQGTAGKSHLSAGLIAGLGVGGALLLVIFVLLWFICCRGKGKQVKSNHENDHYGTQSSGIKGKNESSALLHLFARSLIVSQKPFSFPIIFSLNIVSYVSTLVTLVWSKAHRKKPNSSTNLILIPILIA